ncbi:MAG: glycosyltransferase, partial [Alphaproteobacteria bacterium]|nr:glycosyltransferase [Alphaproteobacteria bacterium]
CSSMLKNLLKNMEIKMKKAVLLLTFNRLDCLKKVFSVVAQAKPPRLYIASDGPRIDKIGEKEKVQEVRDYLLSHINWDCEVKTRFLDINSGGCGIGVSSAITWFFEHEQDGIILEDDCLPSLSFFRFCEKMLDKYEAEKNIYSIVGYIPIDRVYSYYSYDFATVSHCWGWASWADRWKIFKLDISDIQNDVVKNISYNPEAQKYWTYILHRMQRKEINSWYFPWNFCIAEHKGLTIYPTKNLISNIGAIGEHYSGKDKRLGTPVFDVVVKKYRKKQSTCTMNKILWEHFFNLQNPFRAQKQVKTTDLSKSISNQIPTLTIITVCYNIKDEIERTCKSIVNQTWQDFEWIVVDGGSTDGTVDVLKKYANRINILISEPDKGVYNAMNKGIKLAHGTWLNFMNGGDCFAEKDVLEKVFKDKEYAKNILQGQEERYNRFNKLANIWRFSCIDKRFFLNHSMAHQSVFYRNTLFKKYGMYDESYKYCADTELNLRFVAAGENVELLNFIIAKFWLTGISNNKNVAEARRQEHVEFNNKYFTKEELLHYNTHNRADFAKVVNYRLFNFLPLLSIMED